MADLQAFKKYLADKQIVSEKKLVCYIHWVSKFISRLLKRMALHETKYALVG